ncbi:AraC family transcriptional regulator [Paenibacillus sp. S150]|uniref:helix-turn-helix domain-containing protein n=1 Tax=Paenibacillus sp. S150 TaxID=2749826 RepID=UPI001C58A01B|nr:AraC family transcriptional regulator [Paenibacillus sp. S150]MBW4084606.1 helix-turn-helix transcriptional regulator [Paenibacillus sp. S150]
MEINVLTDTFELWKGKSGFANTPHEHADWYQVTLPVKGTCDLLQNRKWYGLQAGEGFLQQPQTEHSFQVGALSAVIVIKFRGSLLNRMNQTVPGGSREYRMMQDFNPEEITALFRNWSYDLLGNETDPLMVQQLEVQVGGYLERLLQGDRETDRPVDRNSFPRPYTADPHMTRVLDYLHSCYMTAVDIESMAVIALQSRYHFIRSFKHLTKLTPYQYVLRLRIGEARERLRLSKETVTEISFALGFSSVTQFYRAFLRQTGMTPTDYRKFTSI